MLPRLATSAAALALVAAACTGGGAATTTTGSDGAAPAVTSTTAPTTTTTTRPPPDPPYLLTWAPAAGSTAVYEIETTYRQTSSGDIEEEMLTIEVDGERHHASFDAGERSVVEVLLDPGRIEVFGTAGPGGDDVGGRGRTALADAGLEPATLDLPVTLFVTAGGTVAGGLAPVAGGTAEPLALARALDALPAPPLPATPVYVGDEWLVGPLELPWIGPATMTAEGTAQVAGTAQVDGAFVVDVEVDLTISAPAVPFAGIAADLLALAPTEGRLAGVTAPVAAALREEIDAGEAAGTVGVTSGRITGVFSIDPDRGLVAAMDTDSRLVVALDLVDDRGAYSGSFVVEARTDARLARIEEGAPPLPADADAAAQAAFVAPPPGYRYDDLDPGRGEEILDRLGLLIDSPLAGVGAARLAADDGGASLDVLSFHPLGFARGDPALAETVAAVVTGEFEAEVGERTVTDGVPVLRFESEGETWLAATTNTLLLVGVGGDDAPAAGFAALVAGIQEHRWQEGECHDVGAGDRFDPPYSPFGSGTLVPCWRPHTVEVTGATQLAAGPAAPFPDDLDTQSGRFCGESFLAYTGSLTSQTRLSGVSYLPDEAEWAEGDRYLACVVSAVDDHGQVAVTTGDLRGAGPGLALELAAGTCFDGGLGGLPVDCSSPHTVEAIGTIRFDDPPDAPYPGRDGFAEQANAKCRELLADYAESLARDGAEIEAFAFGDDVHAWESGVREFACTAGARDGDGSPVRVLRSFSERWRALGPADDAFSA